jgi:protein-serine/threonine kinase
MESEHNGTSELKPTSKAPLNPEQSKESVWGEPKKIGPVSSQEHHHHHRHHHERIEPKKIDLENEEGETSLAERIEEHVLQQQQNPTTACDHPPDKESDHHPLPRKFIQDREELLKKHPDSKEILRKNSGDKDGDDEDCGDDKKKTLSVNQFEMLKLLGVGSAGHVYLVKKKDNKHLYAMKVLKKDKLSTKAQSRILTERNVLLNAHHPFISTLFFCFQTQTKLFIVMQYCAGGDFYSVIQRQPKGCLTEPQAKFYASCVLLALEYLHFNGVVYRDLKPENILMRESGHIVLTDFDLSICSPESVHSRVMTKPYTHKGGVVSEPEVKVDAGLVGTAEYMAPEIIEGKPYTCIVDWWSYGILIYEMLYGKSPFRGKDMRVTFELIRQCHVEFPHHPQEEVSQKAKDLVRALLHHNQKKRLGYNGGAAEIKDHPFFNEVKFQLLSSTTPPILPKISTPTDSHYFKPLENDWPFDDASLVVDPAALPDNSIWKRFTVIDRSELDPDDINQSKISKKKEEKKEEKKEVKKEEKKDGEKAKKEESHLEKFEKLIERIVEKKGDQQ